MAIQHEFSESKVEPQRTNDNSLYLRTVDAHTADPTKSILNTNTESGSDLNSTLPTLIIDRERNTSEAPSPRHWYSGSLNVLDDLALGAYHEVVNHPGNLVKSFVAGAATTAIIGLAGPEIATAAVVGGLAYGAFKVAENVGGWVSAGKTVYDPAGHSIAEVAAAHNTIQNIGGGSIDIAAGVAGGAAERLAASALRNVLINSLDTHAVKVSGVTAGNNITDNSDIDPDDGNPNATDNDTPSEAAKVNNSNTKPAESTTPEEASKVDNAGTKPIESTNPAASSEALTLEKSIGSNQEIFRQAGNEDAIVPSTKQYYNVAFEKATEPRTIQSLESMKTGETESVSPGQWIATRLDDQGNPVIENGIKNSWAVTEKNMLKTYELNASDLEGQSSVVAATRTGAPPVHMVQLKEPLTIKTSWGTMSGDKGAWLANYDYANGQPGHDFAIITDLSYNQTYQPVPNLVS